MKWVNVWIFFSFALGLLGKLHLYLFINMMLHFLVTSNYLSTAYCIDNDDTLGSLWRNSIWYFLLSYQFFCNSEENLRAALGKMELSNRAVEDVMDKVRNRHYQVGTAAYKFASWCLCISSEVLFKISEQLDNIYAVGMHLDIWSCTWNIMWCWD